MLFVHTFAPIPFDWHRRPLSDNLDDSHTQIFISLRIVYDSTAGCQSLLGGPAPGTGSAMAPYLNAARVQAVFSVEKTTTRNAFRFIDPGSPDRS